MTRSVANDDGVVSLADAETLVGEIERLRAEAITAARSVKDATRWRCGIASI